MRNLVAKFTDWLTTLAPKAVTPEDMLLRFGSKSNSGRDFISWCYSLFSETNSGFQLISESFDVWKGLYKEATNIDEKAKQQTKRFAVNMGIKNPDIEQFLFCTETFLALIMKLIVAEVSIQKNIIQIATLRSLIGKDAVEGYRSLRERIRFISSVFEEDVFDWFLEPTLFNKNYQNQCNGLLLEIIDSLDGLDLKNLRIDIIRDLYHGFFDPTARKALGEFYTNERIVEEILQKVGYHPLLDDILNNNNSILLDSSCGSGTFLIGAIRSWKEVIINSLDNTHMKSKILKYITNNIVGIDIHPFAVAMARINYLLAILDLLTPDVIELLEEIKIPIYWSDSLLKEKEVQVSPIVDITIPNLGHFLLPIPEEISHDELILNIRKGLRNNWTNQRFIDEFDDDKKLKYESILINLFNWFRQRKNEGKDGRWITVISNSSFIHSLIGRCRYIVGNPPWVRIHTVDKEIRKILQDHFDYYKKGWNPGLKKTQARFKEQHDYCLAFIESGLRYLEEGGSMGFVLTSKIMQAMYAGLARYDIVKERTITTIKDYSSSGIELFKDATTYPLILVLQKNHPLNNDIDIEIITPQNISQAWKTSQEELPLILEDKKSPWLIAPDTIRKSIRQMQKSSDKFGDIYNVSRGIVTGKDEIYVPNNIIPTVSQDDTINVTITIKRKCEDGQIKLEKHNIELDLIYPFVKGESIRENSFELTQYIIWTHDSNGKVLSQLPPLAKKFFESYRDQLIKRDDFKKISRRKANFPFWTIFRINEEKLKTKVVWRKLSTYMQATLIPSETQIDICGRSLFRKIIVNNTAHFVVEKDNDTALCLSSILNSIPVRVFLQSFSAKNRGGWFSHFSWSVGLIPMPKGYMDIKKDLQSQDSHKIIGKLYGLTDKQLDELNEFHKLITSTITPQNFDIEEHD